MNEARTGDREITTVSCPEPRKPIFSRTGAGGILFGVLGFMSLLWFLIRVIPKPSRATYPCQQAALPLATAFVVWATGLASSALLYVQAKITWQRRNYALAVTWAILTGFVFLLTWSSRNPVVMATVGGLRNDLAGESIPEQRDVSPLDSPTVDPAAVVGAIKSTQAQAEDITFAEITTMVNTAIERAGGLAAIVADGDTVVLKPNVIASQDFTASRQQLTQEVNGIATDYRVIQAVVDAVRELNPNGAVFLMEGSGVGHTPANFAILGYDQVTGLDDPIYLEESCGAWFDTSSVYLQGVTLPADKALYIGANNRYWLNKIYYEADVLISLPVLKNHLATGTTGSVKNVGIGATPPTIYGLGPGNPNPYERWSKIDHGSSYSLRINLQRWIHDYYMCRPVDFVVMDGLQGIENGPLCHEFLNGTQYIEEDQMNARLILAGSDPIAVDCSASLLCGHDPLQLLHLVTLHNDTLGCNDARLIRMHGIKIGDEKQSYQIADSGQYSRYLDFSPPWFAVDSCYVSGDRLCFELTVDQEVAKVEVAVDGEVLRQIRVGEFEEFCFDLDGLIVDEQSEIVVYGYDSYLNYHSETVHATTVSLESAPGPTLNVGMSITPMPTGAVATIRYSLPAAEHVDLVVYNTQGRQVETLQRGVLPAGSHQTTWDASGVAAGVYLVQLHAGGEVTTRKMTIAR